jgi:hypothetical protein
MAGTTTLVTVQGSYKTLDLQLPAEVAIRDLLPLLLAALGMTGGDAAQDVAATWGLGRPDANLPFRAAVTLQAEGVLDGEYLILQEMTTWRRWHDALPDIQQVMTEMRISSHDVKPWQV